ncbi:MAG TPA: two-component regulator propeller domain-containing protein, partial [Edaphobacter sp.]|nr:two-component regulator propeller domain-containing protein [Edaphobacter sp.]
MRSSLHRAIRWLPVLLLVLPSLFASAKAASNLGHQSWTTENGLPQNSVHAIFQSRDGYLWIATEGGIARFNGIEFKIFQRENTPAITSDDISCFAQGNDDALWIGTADGVLRYQQGSFRHYGTAQGLPSSDVLSIAAHDNSIYVLTGAGLAQFNSNGFTALNTPSTPTAIAFSDDSLLIATRSGLLQARGAAVAPAYQQLLSVMQPVQAFGYLPGHTLWQRTAASLTFTVKGNPRTLGSSAFDGARIESFLPGSRGGLWIGTSKGLYHLDDPLSPP